MPSPFSRLSLPAAALALLVPAAAGARTWPTTGGWDIGEIDDGCVMAQEYEGAGESTLYLSLEVDGHLTLAVANSNWSIKEKELYELRFVIGSAEYGGAKSVGTKIGYKPAILTRMSDAFVADFAKGSGITIYRDQTVVDDLSLSGSGAAVQVLRRCAASVKARLNAEARERARLAHIPADPFASPSSASASAQAQPPLPRGYPPGWVTNEDYPASAIRAGEAGTTTVKLTIGVDGRVSGCAVTGSSGSATLDSTTCRLLTMRGRYAPAKDANGEAVPGEVTHTFRWSLPE